MIKACGVGWVIAALICNPQVPRVAAQQRGQPLTVEDVLRNSEIDQVAIAPSGTMAAVVIQRPRAVGANRYGWDYFYGADRSDIWVIPRGRGAPVNITQGEVDGSGYWHPVWSPDGRRLAMVSTRGGDNVRLYVWDVGARRPRRLSSAGVQLDAVLADDGAPMAWASATQVLCAFLPPGRQPFAFTTGTAVRRAVRNRAWLATEQGKRASVSVLDAGVASGEDDRRQGNIALIDVVSGDISSLGNANVRVIKISPSHRHAAIIAEDGSASMQAGVPIRWIEEMAGGFNLHLGMRRKLGIVELRFNRRIHWVAGLTDPWLEPSAAWSPDGSSLTVRGRAQRDDSVTTWTVLASNSRLVDYAPDNTNPRVEANNESTVHRWGTLQLRAKSVRTGFSVLTSDPRDGTLLWTTDSTNAQPVVRLRLNRHLANVADDVGRDSLIKYKAANGHSYWASLLLPAGYVRGRRYPLIVDVYPGYVVRDTVPTGPSPKPHKSRLAFLDRHLFAVRGYTVLRPSIAASTSEPLLTMPGYVLPAIDSLVAIGIADSNRIGLIGHSHGALATYGLLTQTHRFRAAVAINGPSDILHEYAGFIASNVESSFPDEWATTGFLAYEDNTLPGGDGVWLGATPWTDPDRWLRNNPVYHFGRVYTPLMIVHADNDIFYMSHGDVAFQALRRLGRRVRYVRYWGEAHTIESPANIKDLWHRIYAWFGHYLEVYPDSQAAQ